MTSRLAADAASVISSAVRCSEIGTVSAGQVSSAAASMNSEESTGETAKPLVPNVGSFGWLIRAVSMASPFDHLRAADRAGRAKGGHQPVTRQRRAGGNVLSKLDIWARSLPRFFKRATYGQYRNCS